MRVFGPVPSRRFGSSLGINVMASKACSYSCVYCQAGRTSAATIQRRSFAPVDEIVEEVRDVLRRVRQRQIPVDYLSFVPDCEPTLDADLGEEIARLKPLGIPVLVITNGSLLWRDDVRRDLSAADVVSVKVDAVTDEIWRAVNRPADGLRLPEILDGIRTFARSFPGKLVTETMLVRGVNDGTEEVSRIARFLSEVRPVLAYLDVPCRPPAESWAAVPSQEALTAARRALEEAGIPVELLGETGGLSFGFTGDVERDILAIASVHPLSQEQADGLLSRAGADRSVIERLVASGLLVRVSHAGTTFYRRR